MARLADDDSNISTLYWPRVRLALEITENDLKIALEMFYK